MDQAQGQGNRDDLELIRSLRRELEEVRRGVCDLAEENGRLTGALRWYLEDDRRAVDAAIVETVAMRPAFAALGGKPSWSCLAHAVPSKSCKACFPSPPRPRVMPSRPRDRESRP
jgi:hypothetical protein